MADLRVTSWNTGGGRPGTSSAYADRVANELTSFRSDLVLLQEVDRQILDSLYRIYRDDQVVCSPRPSTGSTFEALCTLDPQCCIMGHETLLLTEDLVNPFTPALDAKFPRVAQLLRLRIGTADAVVVNVHLDKRGARSRVAAQNILLKALPGNVPTLIVGDFNENVDGPVGSALQANGFDAGAVTGTPLPGPSGFVVDHAFGKQVLTVNVRYRDVADVSDHPVLDVAADLV